MSLYYYYDSLMHEYYEEYNISDVLFQLLYMAVVLYAPALALNQGRKATLIRNHQKYLSHE